MHVVTGFGETAGAALVESEMVDKVSFTGSREVGHVIMRSGADNLKRSLIESTRFGWARTLIPTLRWARW